MPPRRGTRVRADNKACAEVAKGKRGADYFFDILYKMKFEFGAQMMEMQNPARDGLHFTRAVNVFVYRKLQGVFDDLGMSASKLPRHRPAALAAAYPGIHHDDDGMMKKYVPKKRA